MHQNTEAVYHILAFIFKNEEGPEHAYICKTTSQDLRQVYKNHYTGQNPHTAPWFEMSSPKAPVRMYELESKKMDNLTAYSRYVGWEFFFVDNHYSIANPDFKKNQQYYHPNDIVAYHEIVQNNDLNKLCSEDKDLSTKWHFPETEYTVKFVVSHERHIHLRKEAADHSLSFHKYCQAKFDKAEIRCPNINELNECSQKIREVHNIADNIRNQKLLAGGNTVILTQLADSLSNLATNVASLESAILRLTEAKNDCK